jgi:hypothetical protein
MALSSATPWPAHPSQRRTDKRTLCRIHARSLLHLAAHTSTLALQLRRAVTSLSLSPCIGPHCPHAMHVYKRDHSRAFCSRLWFHRPSVLEHPTTSEQLPEAWPTSPITLEQLPEAWITSPTTSEQLSEACPTSSTTGAAWHRRRAPVSSAPSVARLARFKLELSTMSGRFVVRLGCSR